MNFGGGGQVVHARDSAHLEELIGGDGMCIVMFHAPWCGHCVETKPEFEAAAREHTDATYVMCDCENAVGPETLSRHSIEAFPTIRCYVGGRQQSEHRGDRSKDAIVAWAKSN